MKAPFPWFGGKSRAINEVNAAMGKVMTYCEPFAGSLAVLLQRGNGQRQEVLWCSPHCIPPTELMLVN